MLGEGVDTRVEDQEAGTHGLGRRRVAGVPRELVAQVGEAHRPEHPDRSGQHGGHEERLAQRGRVAPGREAAPEDDHVAQEERGDERVVEIEGTPHVGEERDGQRHHRHPPRERLAPAEVARDLEKRQPREEHEGAAALRHLERQPLLELLHHGGLAGPDGREQVQDAQQADDERHHRVQVGPAQLVPPDRAPRVPETQEDGDRDEEREGDPFLVTPHALEQRAERAAGEVAEGGHGQGPQEAGQQVEEREGHDPHAESPAGGGNGDAKAVGEAARDEEEAAPPAHEADQLLVARALPEPPLEPLAAAPAGELEVDLVGEGVGRHRHRDHDGEAEEAALGQERSGQEHRLALERDAEEEERVAVLEQQRLHGTALRRGRSRAAGPGWPDTAPAPRRRSQTTSSASRVLGDHLVAELLVGGLGARSCAARARPSPCRGGPRRSSSRRRRRCPAGRQAGPRSRCSGRRAVPSAWRRESRAGTSGGSRAAAWVPARAGETSRAPRASTARGTSVLFTSFPPSGTGRTEAARPSGPNGDQVPCRMRPEESIPGTRSAPVPSGWPRPWPRFASLPHRA